MSQLHDAQDKYKEACTNSRRNSAAVNIEESSQTPPPPPNPSNQVVLESSDPDSPVLKPSRSFKKDRKTRHPGVERQKTIEEQDENDRLYVNITATGGKCQLLTGTDLNCNNESSTDINGHEENEGVLSDVSEEALPGSTPTNTSESLKVSRTDKNAHHRRSFSHIRTSVSPLKSKGLPEKSKSVDAVFI